MEFQWVKARDRRYVSVIFGPSLTQILELSGNNSRYHVENLIILPTPSETIVGDEIKKADDLVEHLRQLKSMKGIRATQAATVVDGAAVMTKQVQMQEGMTDSEMESQAWMMAGDLFPKVAEDISLDFHPMGTKTSEGLINVLLVACRKDKVEQRVEILERVGFLPKLVDVSYYSLAHATHVFSPTAEGDAAVTTGILHMGLESMSLVVLDRGDIVYTRELPFNGLMLLPNFGSEDYIAKWLEAIETGKEGGGLNTNAVTVELTPVVQQLLQYYEAASKPKLQSLMLAGPLAVDEAIGPALQAAISIPTEVADPLAGMDLAQHLEQETVARLSPIAMMSVGLAVHGITHDRY